MQKQRLDLLLVEKGLSPSRERAKAWIMSGQVFVNGKMIDKAGTMIPVDAAINVVSDSIGFVSRGGLKLDKALKCFNIDLKGKIVADIGASTGGFTDCSLKYGAAKVYAIDVGYGQLAWSLRNDSRVINMERTNIRYVTLDDIGEHIDFASIDVSFISLEKVLPTVKNLLSADGKVVALIKPQFEAGRDKVGKKGVVRDAGTHEEVIAKVIDFSKNIGFYVWGLTYSPVKGPEGNIEYLLYLSCCEADFSVDFNFIRNVVGEAHTSL